MGGRVGDVGGADEPFAGWTILRPLDLKKETHHDSAESLLRRTLLRRGGLLTRVEGECMFSCMGSVRRGGAWWVGI